MNRKSIALLFTIFLISLLLTACTSPYDNSKPRIVVSEDDYEVRVGEKLVVPVNIKDEDGDVLAVQVSPEEMTQYYDKTTGIFEWTPDKLGEKEVVFTVSDGEATVKENLTLNVVKNKLPVITVKGDKIYNLGETVELTVDASDPDDDNLNYTLAGDLAVYFDPTTKTFTWQTMPGDTGNYELTFVVSDGINENRKKIDLMIEPEENKAPYFTSIGSEEVEEGEIISFSTEEGKQLNFSVKADDDNGDNLSYRVQGELTEYFDPQSQTFNWTPEKGDFGTYGIEFIVDDGEYTARKTVEINVNSRPVLGEIENILVNEGETVNFKVSANDSDNSDEELNFSAAGDLTEYFDDTSQIFNWNTSENDSGIYDITFKVSDDRDATDSKTVEITVNNKPEIDFVPEKDLNNPYSINEEILFELKAIDDDSSLNIELIDWYTYVEGTKINFENNNHFVFNENDNRGTFSWTPIAGDEGYYTITFKVADTHGATNLKSIYLNVQ